MKPLFDIPRWRAINVSYDEWVLCATVWCCVCRLLKITTESSTEWLHFILHSFDSTLKSHARQWVFLWHLSRNEYCACGSIFPNQLHSHRNNFLSTNILFIVYRVRSTFWNSLFWLVWIYLFICVRDVCKFRISEWVMGFEKKIQNENLKSIKH